jgi:diaminopimelate decarboxylase
LLAQDIAGKDISLSSQQPAHNLPELLKAGILFVATSMHQLELLVATQRRLACVSIPA